jgi:hypothetical protein
MGQEPESRSQETLRVSIDSDRSDRIMRFLR